MALPSNSKFRSFFKLLRTLPEFRDPRGRRLSQAFVLMGVALALFHGYTTLQAIHAFMEDSLDWLRQLTRCRDPLISRSYLPDFLSGVDLAALRQLMADFFKSWLPASGWIAGDGKVFRGSSDDGQRVGAVFLVAHGVKLELLQKEQLSHKDHELPVMCELLASSGLDSAKLSFDALYLAPALLTQVHERGGIYLVQLKGNQSALFAHCAELSVQENPLVQRQSSEKEHGRLVARTARLFPLRAGALDERWGPCGLRYFLQVVTVTTEKGVEKHEVLYYVTNLNDKRSLRELLVELDTAARGHWSVESNNWSRDTLMREDLVKVKNAPQALVMAVLRSIALNALRLVRDVDQSLPIFAQRMVRNRKLCEERLRSIGFV